MGVPGKDVNAAQRLRNRQKKGNRQMGQPIKTREKEMKKKKKSLEGGLVEKKLNLGSMGLTGNYRGCFVIIEPRGRSLIVLKAHTLPIAGTQAPPLIFPVNFFFFFYFFFFVLIFSINLTRDSLLENAFV